MTAATALKSSTAIAGTLWLLLLLLDLHVAYASYGVTLQPGGEACFVVRGMDRPSVVSGNYDVLNDASEEIFRARLELYDDPHTELWHSTTRQGSFSVSVDPRKRVEFCMALERSVDDDRVVTEGLPVGFSLYVKSAVQRTLPAGEDGPDAQRALEILNHADSIMLQWRLLLDHFDFLRNREAQHTILTSQIQSRVMVWTLLEAFLVVAMATGQVLYWRKFFEQTRYL